jgi:hypothetical protein
MNKEKLASDAYREGFSSFLNGKSKSERPDYDEYQNSWDYRRHWDWGFECSEIMKKNKIL